MEVKGMNYSTDRETGFIAYEPPKEFEDKLGGIINKNREIASREEIRRKKAERDNKEYTPLEKEQKLPNPLNVIQLWWGLPEFLDFRESESRSGRLGLKCQDDEGEYSIWVTPDARDALKKNEKTLLYASVNYFKHILHARWVWPMSQKLSGRIYTDVSEAVRTIDRINFSQLEGNG